MPQTTEIFIESCFLVRKRLSIETNRKENPNTWFTRCDWNNFNNINYYDRQHTMPICFFIFGLYLNFSIGLKDTSIICYWFSYTRACSSHRGSLIAWLTLWLPADHLASILQCAGSFFLRDKPARLKMCSATQVWERVGVFMKVSFHKPPT